MEGAWSGLTGQGSGLTGQASCQAGWPLAALTATKLNVAFQNLYHSKIVGPTVMVNRLYKLIVPCRTGGAFYVQAHEDFSLLAPGENTRATFIRFLKITVS